MFTLRDVGMRYNGCQVLRSVRLDLAGAGMVSVIGPNGAGKSTLLGIMAGLRPHYQGRCAYKEREVSRWPRRAFAREVSFVPQSVRLEFPFTADQVVMMGRTPHCDGLFESPRDREEVERAMGITDTLAFRGRDFRALSGGEKQRVILASVLAQEPRVMLLDEPVAGMSAEEREATGELLRRISPERTVVVIEHDMDFVRRFADVVTVLHAGKVIAEGTAAEIRADAEVQRVYLGDTVAGVTETSAGTEEDA